MTARDNLTDKTPEGRQKIQVLPSEEARRIAAGEVIDRPSALVREFLDNAIDAGARLIEVFIEEGGIRRTEVTDDGGGMEKEDLELCWLTHATSKIRTLDDLLSARSLGFRGEALAAAAAVSALEILSSKDGREAWKLSVGPGERNPPLLEQGRRIKGTSVRALGLYDSLPARKRFLKRPGSEAAACRQIFNEKALAFPEISFRFTQDGILKCFLPEANSLKDRFTRIFLEEREGVFLHEIAARGKGFSVSVAAGGPELSRPDRRLQFVFANRRRIQDFALLQALEYGLQGWFPNGTHPIGAVFVDIDPALADFNIHPAKREARFTDPGAIHHAVSSALRDFCRRGNMAASLRSGSGEEENSSVINAAVPDRELAFGENRGGYGVFREAKHAAGNAPPGGEAIPGKDFRAGGIRPVTGSGPLAMEALLSRPPEFAPLPGRESAFAGGAAEETVPYADSGKTRYLGRLFELFILVEKNGRLFIIDQHAAHERILYDRFIAGSIPGQELLVPIPFVTESPGDDSFLKEKREELADFGIVIRRESPASAEADGATPGETEEWLIESLPVNWKLSDRETVAEILNLKNAKENPAERWAASFACHSAVKDGDFLDEKTALALAEEALALPVHRCPHGRPILFEISREDLLRAVKRL